MPPSDDEHVLLRHYLPEKTRRSYSRIAWVYDLWSQVTESKALHQAAHSAAIRNGMSVLDVGVGTGRLLSAMCVPNRDGLNVGLDMTRAMLHQATKRVSRTGAASTHLCAGSIFQLPFKNRSFDLVTSMFLFDLLPENRFAEAFLEIKRLLRPGGQVVIGVMTFGSRAYHRFWYGVAKHFGGLLTGCRPVSLTRSAQEAGFLDVQVSFVSQNTFPTEILVARAPNGGPVNVNPPTRQAANRKGSV